MQTVDVGALWRAAREQRGWSRAEAAQAIGLSAEMIRSIEIGRKRPGESSKAAARALGLDGSNGGNGNPPADPARLTLGEYEGLLRAGWSLFYAGRTVDAVEAVQGAVRSLGAQGTETGTLALLGRFQQLSGVLARDDKRLVDAITSGAAAVEIARQVGDADHLASALFRLARTYQQADSHAAALTTVAEAHSLASQCRQPLSGWLKLSRVEVESKAPQGGMSMTEMRRLLDQARADLANRAGTDDSFTSLNAPGIWHIEVLALLSVPGNTQEAQQLIGQALNTLDPAMHRWRYGMQATEALVYAELGDAEACADLAESTLQLTRANSHVRYLKKALATLERNDPQHRNPHVVRLRRVLAAA